jgi:hypothetical protein
MPPLLFFRLTEYVDLGWSSVQIDFEKYGNHNIGSSLSKGRSLKKATLKMPYKPFSANGNG